MKQCNYPDRVAKGRGVAILGLLLLQLGLVALAPANVSATTITVQSDHLDIWENKQQALFTGHVHLVREDFELFCDKLRAFYITGKEGSGIDHALATGHVRMIQGDKQGTSDSAVIDNRKQLVTLSGHAVMEQPGGRVTGETIVHNMITKTTEVTRGENGRVKLRIDDKHVNTTNPAPAPAPVPSASKEEPTP